MKNKDRLIWIGSKRSGSLKKRNVEFEHALHHVEESIPDAPRPSMVETLIEEYGIPSIDGATSAREEAVGLLQVAAEIEHGLMVAYLYGLMTLKELRSDPAMAIREVAVEEMAHLLSVQNLLMVLGEEPHLERQDQNTNNPFSPFKFSLEPVSSHSLAKYVAAERPEEADIPQEMREEVNRIVEQAKAANEGADIKRVGLVYARLAYLFSNPEEKEGSEFMGVPLSLFHLAEVNHDNHIKDSDFASADHLSKYIARYADWGASYDLIILPGIDASDTADEIRNKSLTAIEKVAEQGEGTHGDLEDSHFMKFFMVYGEYANNQGPDWPKSVPVNPTWQANANATEQSLISNPAAQHFAHLFDIRYAISLLTILQYLHFENASEGRIKMLKWTFEEMRSHMADYGSSLTQFRRTRGELQAPFCAAPSFLLLDKHFPDSIEETWKSLLEKHELSLQVVEQLLQSMEENECLECQDCLGDTSCRRLFRGLTRDFEILIESDTERIQYIKQQIT